MRRVATLFLLGSSLAASAPAHADAQGRFDPRREARFMIDANLAYTLLAGDLGDSLAAGPGVEAAGLYQLEAIPLRLGAGGGYSRHDIDEVGGSVDKVSLFALASLLLFSDETRMIPYVQARLGWTQLSGDAGGIDAKRSGLEVGAVAGIDIPVAENISIDVSGLFSWINGGDVRVEGVDVPGTDLTGSAFSLRAGAFFSF